MRHARRSGRIGKESVSRRDRSHPATRSATLSISDRSGPRKAHSHTVHTRQSAARNAVTARRSRSRFPPIFSIQNSVFVAGTTKSAHSCQCQKQPCTNTTARNRGNTKSGVPGKDRSCSRYRNPRRHSALRKRISGLVLRPLIRDMQRLRCSTVKTSIQKTILSMLRPAPERPGARSAARETAAPRSRLAGTDLFVCPQRSNCPGRFEHVPPHAPSSSCIVRGRDE